MASTEPAMTVNGKPVSELKVTELKQELKKRRLSQGGLKKDMVDRLSKFVQENEEISGEKNALDAQNQPTVNQISERKEEKLEEGKNAVISEVAERVVLDIDINEPPAPEKAEILDQKVTTEGVGNESKESVEVQEKVSRDIEENKTSAEGELNVEEENAPSIVAASAVVKEVEPVEASDSVAEVDQDRKQVLEVDGTTGAPDGAEIVQPGSEAKDEKIIVEEANEPTGNEQEVQKSNVNKRPRDLSNETEREDADGPAPAKRAVDDSAGKHDTSANLLTVQKVPEPQAEAEKTVAGLAESNSQSIRVDNLVRPLRTTDLEALLSKSGTVEKFWIDAIKTHCYATFGSASEAAAACKALSNVVWPEHSGRSLKVKFVDDSEVEAKLSAPALPAAPSAAAEPKAAARAPQAARQQQARGVPKREVELPLRTLDELFQKTKAKPVIYFAPLGDQQVAAKIGVGPQQAVKSHQ